MAERLGELLVRENLITLDQLQKALEEQKISGGRLGANLTKLGFINESELSSFMSKQYGVPPINLEEFEIDPELTKLIPEALAKKYQLVPVVRSGSTLVVATSDPSNISAADAIQFRTGYKVEMRVASEKAIKSALDKHYDSATTMSDAMENFDDSGIEVIEEDEEVSISELERSTEDAPVVKLVNRFMADAISKGASDIHLEPYERFFRIRYRIDGMLYEIMRPPLKVRDAITSRIKIMAQLNIAERRLPQDGKIRLKIGKSSEPMDYRVSVLPTLFGEKVVLRLLGKESLQQDMKNLGFDAEQVKHFDHAIKQPYGMVLVTGPSGSGKTTTLYSAITELNQIDTNISTAEDPVEYNIYGINQVHMRDDIGLNFASALRSFLRQDPDIIMVGEIRDFETVEIAIKAALTGHLVLSTLHTNDAPSTITRLLNMGVEPFLVASSILLICSQRLVRKVCPDCREAVDIPPKALIDLGVPSEEVASHTWYKGRGCDRCNNTGYKGRVAVYETMPLNRQIRECVLSGASTGEIRRTALDQGMKTLRMSAIDKMKEGITSMEEVVRVTAAER
ncbi:MAG: type IV-A pilus assembly ATPase PilB [Deltaproteobacteria bacterium]|nr:MAG: type IV-A pilus assembly ATPase PilB [Deltaproteobacteria bacterium]